MGSGLETVQLAQAGITGAPKGGFLGKQVSNTRSGKEKQTDQKTLHPWVFKVKNCEFCLEIQKVISIMISVSVLHLNSISIF